MVRSFLWPLNASYPISVTPVQLSGLPFLALGGGAGQVQAVDALHRRDVEPGSTLKNLFNYAGYILFLHLLCDILKQSLLGRRSPAR